MRLLHGIVLSLFLTAALACGGGSDGGPVPGGSGETSNLVGSFSADSMEWRVEYNIPRCPPPSRY